MQIKTSTLIVGANARTINKSVGKVTSAHPTGQGYGKARRGPQVTGQIEAQVKEEPREYKTQGE
jgi:hypothetical protein|tara:strand:+ start:1141 stop:1332 length:192 start_codon:yes stop_codon:yes gene_type:complete